MSPSIIIFIISICAFGFYVFDKGLDRKINFDAAGFDNELKARPILIPVAWFVLTFTILGFLTLYFGLPQPYIHDEFSYLLNSDTFLNGRLTNPSPPKEIQPFLESFHQILEPSYNSKYFPGQGLFLALGQLIGGHPIIGVWISCALAVAATVWLIREFYPEPIIACLSGLIAFSIYCSGDWSFSYWGGSVPALGGALLTGAIIRSLKTPSFHIGFIAGFGAWLLANSRPFEGLILSTCLGGYLLFVFLTGKQSYSISGIYFSRFVVPAALTLTLGIVWTAMYFNAVTGDYLTPPYLVYQGRYDYIPLFIFGSLGNEPTQLFPYLQTYLNKYQLPQFLKSQEFLGFSKQTVKNFEFGIRWYFLGNVSFLLLPLIGRAYNEKGVKLSLCILFIGAICSLGVTYFHPNYLAPFACFTILLISICLASLFKHTGGTEHPSLTITSVVVVILIFTTFASIERYHERIPAWVGKRQEVQNSIGKVEGKHLILVTYSNPHNIHRELVYNEADLNKTRFVWARGLDKAKNEILFNYFNDRKIWTLHVSKNDSFFKLDVYKPN